MKIILTFLLACLTLNTYGQGKTPVNIGLYEWNQVVMIEPCNLDGTSVTESKIPSKVGQQFRVLEIIDGTSAIIMVLDYTEIIPVENTKSGDTGKKNKKSSDNLNAKKLSATPDFFKYNFKGTSDDYNKLSVPEVNSRNYGTSQKYFKVNTRFIEEYATRQAIIGGALAAGVINFPFKYRPQIGNQDFSGSFNFGAGIGYKFAHKIQAPFTYSVISGYSISNVILDAANSNSNTALLASANNFTAFSFSIGGMIEYQQVQAGLFLGWDTISQLNQQEFDWQYQGRPWISVGFGFAIFSAQKEQASKTPQQN